MWLVIQIPSHPYLLLSSSCGHGCSILLLPPLSLSSSIPTFFPSHLSLLSLSSSSSMAAATSTSLKSISSLLSLSPLSKLPHSNKSFKTLNPHFIPTSKFSGISLNRRRIFSCKAAQVSVAEQSPAAGGGDDGQNWVPVVPLVALPRGERRVIIQGGEDILLLWYKNEVFAIENRSPAEGAYSEGLINAKLTQDGCIVCPTTDSTFDLRTGEVKEWYPNNAVLRLLTPSLRSLFVYPVKTDDQNIYISMGTGGPQSAASTEIVFSGKAQPGQTAADVNVEEVKMVVDESAEGFGFTSKNEVINGKAAVIGFLLLLDFELLTGKGLLKGTGFLDFLYSVTDAFN